MSLSRKQRRDMIEICRDVCGNTAMPIIENNTAYASKSSRDEEGYSATYVSVEFCEGKYTVEITNRGRDCDGEHSTYRYYNVYRRNKPRRIYLESHWVNDKRGGRRVRGKFDVRRFVYERISESQRDLFAEMMGY